MRGAHGSCCRAARITQCWRVRATPAARAAANKASEASTANKAAEASTASKPTKTPTSAARYAIVTTVKDVDATAVSWCAYHLSIGFDHLFVYFDDPNECERLGLSARFSSSQLTCIPRDARLAAAWPSLPSWGAVEADVTGQVQARQRLNCEHCAHRLAPARGVRWLLHIDSDEAFHLGSLPASPPGTGPSGQLSAHFEALQRAGVWQYSYGNVEAVPHAQLDAADPFRTVVHFRVHEDWVRPSGRSTSSVAAATTAATAAAAAAAAATAAMAFWQARTLRLLQSPRYFLFYTNGKSAVRLGTPGLMCAGVHGWVTLHAPRSGWRTNLPSLAQRARLSLCATAGGPMAQRPMILHYACCSLTNFARKDWPALGYLGAGSDGRYRVNQCPHAARWDAMQRQATKATTAAARRTGGPARAASVSEESAGLGERDASTLEARRVALRDDFVSLIALTDRAEMARQVAAGVMMRVDAVATRVAGDLAICGEEEVAGGEPAETKARAADKMDAEAKVAETKAVDRAVDMRISLVRAVQRLGSCSDAELSQLAAAFARAADACDACDHSSSWPMRLQAAGLLGRRGGGARLSSADQLLAGLSDRLEKAVAAGTVLTPSARATAIQAGHLRTQLAIQRSDQPTAMRHFGSVCEACTPRHDSPPRHPFPHRAYPVRRSALARSAFAPLTQPRVPVLLLRSWFGCGSTPRRHASRAPLRRASDAHSKWMAAPSSWSL